MAQSFVTDNGSLLTIPGTYVNTNVKTTSAGIPTIGVVTLIGEADEGLGFMDELDPTQVFYGPDAEAELITKFGSGRIVDAFRGVVSAANDPEIGGSVNLVRILKTNKSVASQLAMKRAGFVDYAKVVARKAGSPGNLIKVKSVSTLEVAPETVSFAFVSHYGASALDLAIRVNGGVKKDISVAPLMSAASFVSAVTDYSKGIMATGGEESLPLTGKSGVSISSVAAGTLTVSLAAGSTFGSVSVGDTVIIPESGEFGATADSALLGSGGENKGVYVVKSLVNTVSSAIMVLEPIHAPNGISSETGSISVEEKDLIVWKPVKISNITGMDRGSLIGKSGTFTSVIASTVSLTVPSWAVRPVAGDIAIIPSTFAGIAVGFYEVISATSNKVVLSRLSSGSAGVSGSQAVGSPIIAGSEPVIIKKPVIDGLAKNLELTDMSEFVRKTDGSSYTPSMITSAVEHKVSVTVSKESQTDTFVVGGEAVVAIGCEMEDATVMIDDEMMVFSVGSVEEFRLLFDEFKTMSDVVDFINSHSDWSSSLTLPKFSSMAPIRLDNGTFGVSGAGVRIKHDADLFTSLVSASPLIVLESVSRSGLPEDISNAKFLAGGSKGSSKMVDIFSALEVLEGMETNFVVPLFSRDAALDIEEGSTASDSDYEVISINAAVNSHVIKMSSEKERKNRLAICSFMGSFDESKEAAQMLASFRSGLAFESVKVGTVEFQPWMAACKAAGMQIAAGYRGIVKKQVNISSLMPVEGFNSLRRSQLEDALKSGLLVIEPIASGGFRWVSDQMTYSADNNFVYNSLQAMYVSDLMALLLIERFDRAVVGQSVADVSAPAALSFLDSVMFDFLRLKWISPSDDAPRGYRNAIVKIDGGVMRISVEVKLAGLIYFVPINLTISEVSQTATQQ